MAHNQTDTQTHGYWHQLRPEIRVGNAGVHQTYQPGLAPAHKVQTVQFDVDASVQTVLCNVDAVPSLSSDTLQMFQLMPGSYQVCPGAHWSW